MGCGVAMDKNIQRFLDGYPWVLYLGDARRIDPCGLQHQDMAMPIACLAEWDRWYNIAASVGAALRVGPEYDVIALPITD